MRWLLFLLSFGLISCSSPSENELHVSKTSLSQSKHLNTYFNALTQLKKFNGGVLIHSGGDTIIHKVFTMDTVETLQINKNAQFDIHSISKLMAQACIVDLEADQLILRSNTVHDFIPDFPNGDQITIQHLIDNQSGLPRGFTQAYDNLIDRSPEELMELIQKESLLFAPGSETHYSNLGYQILYFIIAKITNRPFVQYVKDSFFTPLDMNRSGAHFYLDKSNLSHLVTNHENDDGVYSVVPNVQSRDKNQAKIYSSLSDLMLFIQQVKKEPYLAALKNKQNEVGWSGGGDGILSHAKASLDGNYEVVFFSNYDEIPFGDIIQTIDKIMKNQPYTLPKKIHREAIEVDVDKLQQYTGKYLVKEFNNDTFEFKLEQNQLVFYQNGERSDVVYADTDSTFFDQVDAEDYFTFRLLKDNSYDLIFNYKKIEILGKRIIE